MGINLNNRGKEEILLSKSKITNFELKAISLHYMNSNRQKPRRKYEKQKNQ